MKLLWKYLIIITAFLSSLSANHGRGDIIAAEQSPKTLAVIGVTNETGRTEWDNQLIAYGLSHLVLQGLYDTGRYVPLEDNPEIVRETKRLITAQWQGEQPRFSPDEADRLAGRLRSNAVAYAVVKKFSTRRHRMFLGMASGATTKVIVKIEIFLKEPGQALRSATGTGEATTKAKGVFFQIRQDTVYFDETAVGRAAHQAIANALKGL